MPWLFATDAFSTTGAIRVAFVPVRTVHASGEATDVREAILVFSLLQKLSCEHGFSQMENSRPKGLPTQSAQFLLSMNS